MKKDEAIAPAILTIIVRLIRFFKTEGELTLTISKTGRQSADGNTPYSIKVEERELGTYHDEFSTATGIDKPHSFV